MNPPPDAAVRWQRLSLLFEEFLDLDEKARRSRLEELDVLEPDVAPKLRRMLDAHRGPAATLDADWRVAMELTSSVAADVPAMTEEPSDRSGETIDEYRLIRRVGRGGMGEVYLAERVGSSFAQRVALKLLRRGVDTEDVIRRFVQERSILARLEHSGIARLIDGGMSGEGLPYLVMEYVEGEPLTAYARVHDLDVEARLRLLIAVCEAVDFAHRRLVVHRDLKPSNVMVANDGTVKLLDFGIAKLLDADAGDEALTGTGMRVLSPAYAAPEQFLGEPIGTATDVYALGVLLFELLTGELPHQRTARSLDVLAQSVTQERVEKPSAVLRRHSHTETARRARRLEGDLDTIVLTALKREPERRYASAAAFAQDLRAYLDGRPITAHPDTFGYRAGKFVRRNRLAVGSASLVLLAIVGGLAIALWQTQVAQAEARRADAQTRVAQREAARAEQQLVLAERTRQFVVKLFEGVDPTVARDGKALTAEDFIRDGIRRVDTELADAPIARAELRVTLARALTGLGNYKAAIPELERGIQELRSLGQATSSNMANTLNILAIAHVRTENPQEGGRVAKRGLAILERLPGDYRHEKIQMRTVTGSALLARGDVEGALSVYLANLADRRGLFGENAVETAVDHNNLCAAYNALDRPVEGERAARAVLKLLRDDRKSPKARQAWALSGIARSLVMQGRYDEAATIYGEMRTLLAATLPADHPMQGSPDSGEARIAIETGRYEEAYDLLARTTRLYAATKDKDLGTDSMLWGYGLLEQERNAEAESKLGFALKQLRQTHGDNVPVTLKAQAGHGLALARMGQTEDGIAESTAALAAFGKGEFPRGTLFGESALAYAQALRLDGQSADAAQWQERGLGALEKTLGPAHPRFRRLRERAH